MIPQNEGELAGACGDYMKLINELNGRVIYYSTHRYGEIKMKE